MTSQARCFILLALGYLLVYHQSLKSSSSLFKAVMGAEVESISIGKAGDFGVNEVCISIHSI